MSRLDDGLVLTLDFTGRTWASAPRRGQKLVTCEHCGGKRQGSAGPHGALVVADGVVRDCIGRRWVKTPEGYVPAAAREAA